MARPLQVIDSGVTEGRLNIALGQALIDGHRSGELPDTLRFLRFPPTALIGRHQVLAQEVNLDFCRDHGVGLARRITGGGAIYLDPGQLGWELVIRRGTLGGGDLTDLARRICEAAAGGLRKLGVEAAFRPRNDIEVGGRKISGTGGFFDGDTLFFQGTVLVDLDPERMLGALRVPRAKLEKRALDSAAQRVVTLRELLGERCPGLPEIQAALAAGLAEGLALEPMSAELAPATRAKARRLYEEEIGRDEFLDEVQAPVSDCQSGEHTGAGGTIRTHLTLQGAARNRVGSVLFTGDFFVTPPRVLMDLEAALRGAPVDTIDQVLERFFQEAEVDALSVSRDDFAASIRAALDA
jgi:lipoate-protein ligase A